MFNDYIRKILPIPITEIESNKDGYKYRITTYSSVINESGVTDIIKNRIKTNKKIKLFDGWYLKNDDYNYKQAIIEFVKPSKVIT